MTRPAALLILPSQPRTAADKDVSQTSDRLLAQCLEDLYLSERVARALRAAGLAPLRNLEVAVHERLVILAGRVPSYYLKQVAQEIALTVPGAHQVRNDLDVVRPS